MKGNSKIIIQCIRTGQNNDALKYLYKDPLRKIRRFIMNNSGTLEDADDVFQDAVVALFHYVQTGKYKEEYDLDAFLFRVAKHSWIDLVRKKKKIIKDELIGYDIPDEKDQLDDIIKEEQLNAFQSLFNSLEDNCKKILSFVLFEKKSMKEIADLMGMKDEKVAKNQHYRCKKYFSKLVSENQEALDILRN
ncbi:MAG: sigma-70 family RNA polymerase sigma factor [Sporocytophaga sp.]|uniref:RNA polymerase sigma factor n=1 Tax=Sporocytophaga sp. TaxID=2231183 RepID=UPI001B2ABD1B|nr:sigma-70 family RNA polymerase sigma factor [Sporocytophaga sp.]MBO9703609.1 sigma-70 family RNA polymerase sigma factor [Sporocytophaga sp.]